MTKQQATNLIGAGTIAAVMLILALVFGGDRNPAGANGTSNANPQTVEVVTDTDLAVENEQLKETVQILQEREAQFVEQINIANEQLAGNANGEGEYEEGEAYEEEEPEEEEDDEDDEEDD